jgi:hypothetical protein
MGNTIGLAKNILRKALPRKYYDKGRERSRQLAENILGDIHKFDYSPFIKEDTPSPYPFPVSKENLLEELGEKYEPSKRWVNYLPFYWMHFRDIRLDVRRVCEIGVQTERSVRMWEEFFPNAMIYGMDIDERCKEVEGGGVQIFIGDQSDPNFLNSFLSTLDGPLDIVIDDGSHIAEHQLKTFEVLFPSMATHGIYVVEDVQGEACTKTVNSFKQVADNVMYWPKGYPHENWPQLATFDDAASWADRHIVGIAFYRHLIFIMRGRNPEDNPFLALSAAAAAAEAQ